MRKQRPATYLEYAAFREKEYEKDRAAVAFNRLKPVCEAFLNARVALAAM